MDDSERAYEFEARGPEWIKRLAASFLAAAERQHLLYGPTGGLSDEELDRRKRALWAREGPVFSTTHRDSLITILPPGNEPGRVTAALVGVAALAAAAWAAMSYLGLASLLSIGSGWPDLNAHATTWWWITLAVLSLHATGLATWRLHRRVLERFGRRRFVRWVRVTCASLGLAVGAALVLIGYGALDGEAPTVAAVLDGEGFWSQTPVFLLLVVAVPAGAVAVVGLCWSPFSMRLVRRRQRLIERLRASELRFDGEVESTSFRRRWDDGFPQFDAVIRYEAGGVRRTFSAAMTTSAGRVPLPGFPVRIMVDEQSATLVEPDDVRPGYDFDPAAAKYVEPSGD